MATYELPTVAHFHPLVVFNGSDRTGRFIRGDDHARESNKRLFRAFDYSRDALTEVDRFFRQTGKAIVPLTVREILDEEIARKLAPKPLPFIATLSSNFAFKSVFFVIE